MVQDVSRTTRDRRFGVDAPMLRRYRSLSRTSQAIIVSVTLACTLTACAPLTRSQVKEVQEFAKAAQNYGALPGDAISAYRDVFRARRALAITTRTISDDQDAKRDWNKILEAFTLGTAFEAKASQADYALRILDTYSELLVVLSSDRFTEELEKSATSLAKSLDKTIGEYNKKFDSQLGTVGAAVAAVVRGIGGLVIRYRQATLIKHYVRAADPVVDSVSKDVEAITKLFGDPPLPPDKKSIIELEPCDPEHRLCLELSEFKMAFLRSSRKMGRADLQSVQHVSNAIAKIDKTHKLARLAAHAASRYRVAHAELTKKLSQRKTLKERIEVIRVLADEIRAARGLQKALEN